MTKYLVTIVLVAFSLGVIAQPDLLQKDAQNIFVSGINLAWLNFGNDLRNLDQDRFTTAVKEIKAAGGNSIRWWIHANCLHNPVYSNGKVSGIEQSDIGGIRTALDIAYSNGILIDLCLFSNDMLQVGDTIHNRYLLTDTAYTNAYIKNALLPMVRSLKGHPGILAWEIINEPEAISTEMGWVSERVDMEDIQKFVNIVAGAIHREDTNALVTTGNWALFTCSDVDGGTNYYRPDRLIAAGGDTLGYLDFYMPHYYVHNGTRYSPFRHPASYWNLDKPIVIGEFPANGFLSESPALTIFEAYKYAYDNGYAGALSWAYTGGQSYGGLDDCAIALDSIEKLYHEHITIVPSDTFVFDYPPEIKKRIPDQWIYLGNHDTVTVGKLMDWFTDKDDTTSLIFEADSQSYIANVIITPAGELKLLPQQNIAGISEITIRATDETGKNTPARFIFSIIDSTSENKLKYRTAYASSTENFANSPICVVDSNQTTRWASSYFDNQWILVKLEKEYIIRKILINWENAYGREYQVQVSADSINWQTVYEEYDSDGGYDKIVFNPVGAKYIRLNCINRATSWGFSIYEIEAYSDKSVNHNPYFLDPLNDKTVTADGLIYFSVNGFATDPDPGDKLMYDITLVDGSELPSWLSYNSTIKILSGNPSVNDTGTYKLIIIAKDLEGAEASETFSIHVIAKPTGVIAVVKNPLNYHVYPNPCSNILKISCASPTLSILSVYSINGVLVNKFRLSETNQEIDISDLKDGLYFIRIENVNSCYQEKIIKITE